MTSRISDEHALELIWTSIREQRTATSECLRGLPELPELEVHPEDLESLVLQGLVERHGEEIRLTREGLTQAEAVVRKHRLAERLMADVLELDESAFAVSACRFEHVLSDEVM